MKKLLFYALSFTWGIIMTIIGFVVAFVLVITGHKPKKYGLCYHFEMGKGRGGLSLGMVMLTNVGASTHIRNHEHGHALQNCIWGPLMPFVIMIPSAARYWLRELWSHQGKHLDPYDSVWFEGQASKWGTIFIDRLEDDDSEDN